MKTNELRIPCWDCASYAQALNTILSVAKREFEKQAQTAAPYDDESYSDLEQVEKLFNLLDNVPQDWNRE